MTRQKVDVIPASVRSVQNGGQLKSQTNIRVAAYCRVSTGDESQLKTIYKDAAETIIGNCDTMLFLGGKESSTLKEISETLGKETIDLYNTSDTRGQSPSFGTTYQKTGKELMSRDELSVMDGSKCILQLRGVRPFLSDKFDITKHKRYKELSDFDKKNAFDVERYLKHELRLRMDEEFDCYEVDVSEESTA